MKVAQAIVIVIVALMLGIAEALRAMENLPLSAQTCQLGGVALVSLLLILLQSKSQGKSNDKTEASKASENPAMETQQKQWWYRDAAGNIQGPFTTAQMHQWYKEGYVALSLMVRFGDMDAFRRVSDLFPEQSVPFVSEPQVSFPTREPSSGTREPSSDDEKTTWSSDDEQAVIRKWRASRRARYKQAVCEMVEPVQ